MIDLHSRHCIKFNEMRKHIIDRFKDDKSFIVRSSSVDRIGVFSRREIHVGERFNALVIGYDFDMNEFNGYLWELKTKSMVILDGIGFLANGSCSKFEELQIGNSYHGYTIHRKNMILDSDSMRYVAIRDIPEGTEVFLDYGDEYFE